MRKKVAIMLFIVWLIGLYAWGVWYIASHNNSTCEILYINEVKKNHECQDIEDWVKEHGTVTFKDTIYFENEIVEIGFAKDDEYLYLYYPDKKVVYRYKFEIKKKAKVYYLN